MRTTKGAFFIFTLCAKCGNYLCCHEASHIDLFLVSYVDINPIKVSLE